MSISSKNFCKVTDLLDLRDFMMDARHNLHRNPELSFDERDTSEFIASHLVEWGYDVARGVGGHGVVGTVRVGNGERSIGIRADMDALPIKEQTGLPYASQREGGMHACGHDGHTTILLGAARQLVRTRNFNGTVHLIFQPAEEAGKNGGAERMLADGLFERFPCDAIFGLHNHPGRPVGTFLFRSGPFMSAVDTVTITVHGRGGHAARPHQAIDPIMVAGSLVMALQTIVSRNVSPTQAAVVTVGMLNAGTAPNVIPDFATLRLSVRSFDEEVRSTLRQRITALVNAHAQGYGASTTIEYQPGYPVLVNSEAETALARSVAAELVGPDRVVAPADLVTGSEDFAYYLRGKPGCFLRLGNGEDSVSVHNAHYDFNDENLCVGAAYWTRLVERYLS